MGVFLDPRLKFNLHIEMIVNNTFTALGCIERWATKFYKPYINQLLFTWLLRSILEYTSVVWCPQFQRYISQIETFQNQFAFGDPAVHLPPYENRLTLISLHSLSSFRKTHNICQKVIHVDINSSLLPSYVSLHVLPLQSRIISFL